MGGEIDRQYFPVEFKRKNAGRCREYPCFEKITMAGSCYEQTRVHSTKFKEKAQDSAFFSVVQVIEETVCEEN